MGLLAKLSTKSVDKAVGECGDLPYWRTRELGRRNGRNGNIVYTISPDAFQFLTSPSKA